MWPPRLTPRSAFIMFIVLLTFFIISLRQSPELSQTLLNEIIDAYVEHGERLPNHSKYPSSSRLPLPTYNPHLAPLLKCQHEPNAQGHIVLPAHHLTISLQPDVGPPNENQYFNPTIIPLPSYAASLTSARYLLVTRLVTKGMHQESHACLAAFYLPSPSPDTTFHSNKTTGQHLSPDTSPLTARDSALLGPQGGLRCLTPPEPLNIPPTPSLKCSEKWAPFPDIPGFHDPRIMWSGRGEPLIVVNSGSMYGCVGLWVVDLRVLVRVLRDVVERRRPETEPLSGGGDDDGGMTKRNDMGGSEGTPWWKTPVVRFDSLIELTRFEGRAEVEKNWMLWWPGDGREMRVSFEMFGRWEEVAPKDIDTDQDDQQGSAEDIAGSNSTSIDGIDVESQAVDEQDSRHRPEEWLPWLLGNFSLPWNHTVAGIKPDTTRAGSEATNPISIGIDVAAAEAFHLDSTTVSSMSSNKSYPDTTTATNMIQQMQEPIKKRSILVTATLSPLDLRTIDELSEPSSLRSSRPPAKDYIFHPGRSTAHLQHSSHALLALPNSTHPDEPPCLLPPDDLPSSPSTPHNLASTHQSTPSLRLILCQRSTGPSCTGTSNQDGIADEWLKSGMEVHFSIVHRKLRPENELGLVEKGGYERWVVVWEGREPGRIVARGRWGVGFEGEGWDDYEAEEQVAGDMDGAGVEDGDGEATLDGYSEEGAGEKTKRSSKEGPVNDHRFVYTTSISWAWRVDDASSVRGSTHHDTQQDESDENPILQQLRTGDIAHLSSLGTGFLGDDVIIGIGIDDVRQAVVRIKVDELLSCLMLCPGVVVHEDEGHEKV